MESLANILKAKKYSDLFSSDEATAKREFREYCKKYHPDVNDTAEEAEAFSIISEIYTYKIHKSTDSRKGAVDEEILVRDKSTGKGFILTNPVVFNNGICTVYYTVSKVAFLYSKTYKKFYDNYIEEVERLRYADNAMEKEFSRYFPKIIKHFETEDDKLCILIGKTSDVLPLGRIFKAYRDHGEQFPERQAAWILNRLYNIECYLHYYGRVSNGFTIDNLWVSPEMHSILLYSGWEYTTKERGNMIGCPKDVFKIIPIKVKDTKESSMITDLESIKSIGRQLYNGHTELKHINKFLNEGTTGDVFKDWDSYREALQEEFGKRQFVVWDNIYI